jgi:hypothetical protein
MSLMVDGINMNRIISGGGGGGDSSTSTVYKIRVDEWTAVVFIYLEAVPYIIKETFQIMYVELKSVHVKHIHYTALLCNQRK